MNVCTFATSRRPPSKDSISWIDLISSSLLYVYVILVYVYGCTVYVCAFVFSRRNEGHLFFIRCISFGRAAVSRKQQLNSLLRNYTMESNHPEQCSLISSAERLDHPQGACVPQAPRGSGLAPLLFHPPCCRLHFTPPTYLTTRTWPQPTAFFFLADQGSDGEGEMEARR